MSSPYSIFDELTRLATTEPAPATDLIAFLIRSLAQEACDGIRGAQTYYRIVSRARDICNSINVLAKEAENQKDWDKYQSYTAQISPLEELLFDISKVMENEAESAYSPSVPDSVQQCIDDIKCWKDNREIFRGVAKTLHDSPFERPGYAWDSDLKAAALHDDLSWITTVCEALMRILEPISRMMRKKPQQYLHVTGVIQLLAQIQTSLELNAEVEESAMVLSTRCFMVIHGMIALTLDKNVDEKVRKHLWSRRTWKKASGSLEKLKLALESPPKPLDALIDEWDGYERYLLNPEDESVDKILEGLIRYPAKIQRPYHSQALALVYGCKSIGAHVDSKKPEDGIEKLEDIVELTIKALEKCGSAATEVAKLDWDELRVHPASKGIDGVVIDIKRIYSEYQMKVDEFNKAVSDALKKDREMVERLRGHLSRLQTRQKPVDPAACQCGEDYQIQLAVSDRDRPSPRDLAP
ncbi:hypothetical protein FRC02_011477, partial [Tulasnella sp. 418]